MWKVGGFIVGAGIAHRRQKKQLKKIEDQQHATARQLHGKNAIGLEDGSWADLSTSSVVCTWTGRSDTLPGKHTFTLLRTERGSLIVKRPMGATGMRTKTIFSYLPLEPDDAIEYMVSHDGEKVAKKVLPTEYEEFQTRFHDMKR